MPVKQVKDIVRNYLIHYRSHKQDTCIVEYELLRKNNFSKNEYISVNVQEEVKFIVNAIKAIGDNTLSNPNKELRDMLRRKNWAMQIEASLNYVSSEIFQILNVRTTSDSTKDARKYLRNFITAFFRLIPKNVIEKYDTLYENREKEMKKKAARDKESCEMWMTYLAEEKNCSTLFRVNENGPFLMSWISDWQKKYLEESEEWCIDSTHKTCKSITDPTRDSYLFTIVVHNYTTKRGCRCVSL